MKWTLMGLRVSFVIVGHETGARSSSRQELELESESPDSAEIIYSL